MQCRILLSAICLASLASIAAADGPLLTTFRIGPASPAGGPLGIAAGIDAQLNSQDYSGKTKGDPLPIALSFDVVAHSRFTNFPALVNFRLDPPIVGSASLPVFCEFGLGGQLSAGKESGGPTLAYGASAGLFLNHDHSTSLEVRYYGSGNARTNSIALLFGVRS